MNNQTIRTFISRTHVFFALECAVSLLLAYYCAYWFSILTHYYVPVIAGLWAGISAAFVVDVLCENALKMALNRIVGSTIGCVVPMICIYIFGYNIFAFGFSVFFAILCCYGLKVSESYRVTLITLVVVVLVGGLFQAHVSIWFNALSRLLDSIIGIVITLAVVFLLHPLRIYFGLLKQ